MSPEAIIDWAIRIGEWLVPFDELIRPSAWSPTLLLRLFADTIILTTLGWGLAWFLERRHLKQLVAREAALDHIQISNSAEDMPTSGIAGMITGNVVLSHDLFRAFRLLFRRLVGGYIQPLERLAERGRREAILRLKAEAASAGITRLINLRIHTTPLSPAGSHRFEVSAYATGIVGESHSRP